MQENLPTYNLTKDIWTKRDKDDFIKHLETLGKDEKSVNFEKSILNTEYKCLAVSSKEVDKIVNLIYKGNFLSFIDLWIVDNHTSLIITGKLIAKIKGFNLFKEKLLKYLGFVDSWAGCDSLKLKVSKKEQENFYNLATELVSSNKPFYRRFGLIILFKLINEEYIDKILDICNSLEKETHYYVNMANAWLVCESFIKRREKTLSLIKAKTLNKFVQNKAISKCRDSFRVSKEDKELLKSLRIR